LESDRPHPAQPSSLLAQQWGAFPSSLVRYAAKMISLIAAAVAGDVAIELPVSVLSPMRSVEVPMPFMLGGLQNMLAELHQIRPVAQRLSNPCAQDIARLRCTDSACLKRSADELTPVCASFLLGEPQPSPAPEAPPTAVSTVRSTLRSMPMRQPSSSGFFSMEVLSSDGKMQRVSGPMPGGATLSPMSFGAMPSLGSFLPPELRAFMQGIMQVELDNDDEDEEDDDEEGMAQHPCQREVPLCIRETNSRATDAITACLRKHIEQLSPECKCFLHHMQDQRAPQASVASAPTVHVVQLAKAPAQAHGIDALEAVNVAKPPPGLDGPHHPAHHISCLFFFTTLFVVAFMVARACVHAMCGSRPVRRIVVVPPPDEPSVIASRPRKVEAVQVAEPYVKA